MTWCWLALAGSRPAQALAYAELHHEDGSAAGGLAAWSPGAEPPVENAAKVDARAIDSSGEPALLSLVLAPPGVRLLFDDPAVSQALRSALVLPRADVLSTLSIGGAHFAGAVTAVRDAARWRLDADPFAAVFPARRLRVASGLLGVMPALTGPTIQRYGSGNPWPWDRFDD